MKRSDRAGRQGWLVLAAGLGALLSAAAALAQPAPAGAKVGQAEQPATAPAGPAAAGSTATAPAALPTEKPKATRSTSAPAGRKDAAEGGKDGASVALTRPGTFEIHVQGADLRGVLQLLSTQGKRNIIATKEVQGNVTADLYGVTFEQALKAVLASSGFDFLDDDGFIYVYTNEQKDKMMKAKVEVAVKVFHLAYISAADAQVLITPALSEQGSIAVSTPSQVGVSSSKTEAGGNSLASNDMVVVRDVPKRLEKIEALIKELDIKPDQVLVETTILSAKLGEQNKLGINFNTLAGADFQNLNASAASSGTPTFTSDPLSNTTKAHAVNFRTDFTPVTGGMTFGVFGSDAAFFVTALETVTDVTVLANPKLLVLNKQRGEVIVGRRDGYLTTTLTETTATQTVQFLETGTRLLVRPFIGKDHNIRMEIHPEDSDGSVQNELPSETTTEITSNVMVRDGHTIVIGGLFRENTGNSRTQVPLLGNIPYLGTLFRTTNDSTDRSEVIILITPHIVNQPTDEAIGEQMKDDVERVRIGQRKGLPFWANDRLADSALQAAKKDLRDGKFDRALWNLDLALSMSPRMIEAIQLKERLTRKAYWADMARVSTIRYVIESLVMQELGKPVEEVIPPNRPLYERGLPPDVKKAFGIDPPVLPPMPWEPPTRKDGNDDSGGPAVDPAPSPTSAPAAPADKAKTQADKPAEKTAPVVAAPTETLKIAVAAQPAETPKATGLAPAGTTASVVTRRDEASAATADADDDEDEDEDSNDAGQSSGK